MPDPEDPRSSAERRLRGAWRTPLTAPGIAPQAGAASGIPAARTDHPEPPALVPLPAPPTPRTEPVAAVAGEAGIVDLRRSTLVTAKHAPQPWWRRWMVFGLVVVLPTLIGLLYWSLICSYRYTATAQFSIHSEIEGPAIGALSLLGLTSSSAASDDARTILAFVPSADMLQQAEAKLEVRKHFSDRRRDWFSRLAADATNEDALLYWQNRVTVRLDDATGLVVVSAQAFDPEYALRLVETLLSISEDHVNTLGLQMVQARKDFLEHELATAQDALREAKRQLVAFQNEHGVLDPGAEAGAVSGVLAQVMAELVQSRAELAELLSEQSDSADAVQRLKARIAGLEAQALKEREGIVGANGQAAGNAQAIKMNSLESMYQDLLLTATFRNDAYRAVLTAYQTAESELNHRLKHLQVVVRPLLPQKPSQPEVLYDTVTLLLIALGLWFTGATAYAIVREHTD